MGTSVFGTPITAAYLAKMEEYKYKTITTRDMANVAFEMKNEDGKDARARAYVDTNRVKYGNTTYISCLIYNATGDTIRLKTYCEPTALIGANLSPSPYPMLIMNGQWGAYLVSYAGAVVYAAKNETGVEYQVVYSYGANVAPSKVYTGIQERGHYRATDPWTTYSSALDAKNTHCYETHHVSGLSSFATMGVYASGYSYPVFEGIITLNGAWPNNSPVTPAPTPCSEPRLALLTAKTDELAVSDEQQAKGN
ncbi:hypothetical protein RND81_04G183300 [Saponaria officinalis]|uniref:Uncharacterized protein n=1 Tax=Saponaria officinalis TaxID=3572 RepID=A0AAW1LMM9_SAPOF